MVLLEENVVSATKYVPLASALKRYGYHAVVSADKLTVEGSNFAVTDSVDQINFSGDMILLPALESQDTLKGMIIGIISPKLSSKAAIVNFVGSMGIKNNLKGYYYLITAISLAVQDPSLLNKVTYALYSAVAKVHGVDQHCVERNIRSAINSAYQNDPDRICCVFHDYFSKPYSSKIITLTVDSILNNIKL